MFFSVWQNTKADLSAETWKELTCANCGQVFVYHLGRVASARATRLIGTDAEPAMNAAARRAADRAEAILASATDPVPCPQCGMYQDDMVRALRRPKGRILLILGVFVLLLSAIIGYAAPLFDTTLPDFPRSMLRAPWIFGPLAGLWLIVLGLFRRMTFDPNADAHTRIGKPPSPWDGPFTRGEFEKRVHETEA